MARGGRVSERSKQRNFKLQPQQKLIPGMVDQTRERVAAAKKGIIFSFAGIEESIERARREEQRVAAREKQKALAAKTEPPQPIASEPREEPQIEEPARQTLITSLLTIPVVDCISPPVANPATDVVTTADPVIIAAASATETQQLNNLRETPEIVHDFIRDTFSSEGKSFKEKVTAVIDFINSEIELGSQAHCRSNDLSKIFHKLFRIRRHVGLDSEAFQLLQDLSTATCKLLSQNAYNDYVYANIALLFMGNSDTKATYDLCISRILKELRAHETPLSTHSFNELAQLMEYAVERSPELLEIGQILVDRMPQKPFNDREFETALGYISSSKTEDAAQTLLEKIKPQIESKSSYQSGTLSRVFLTLMSIEREDCRTLAFQTLDKFFTILPALESTVESIESKLQNFSLSDLHRLLAGLRHFPKDIGISNSAYAKFFRAISNKISHGITSPPPEDKYLACLGIMQEYSVIRQKFNENGFFADLLKPLYQTSHPIHHAAETFLSAAKERRSQAEGTVRNILLLPELEQRLRSIDKRVESVIELRHSTSWFEQDVILRITPNFAGGQSKFDVDIEVDGEFIHQAKARTRIISQEDRDATLLKTKPPTHTIRIVIPDSRNIDGEDILNRVINELDDSPGIKELMKKNWG